MRANMRSGSILLTILINGALTAAGASSQLEWKTTVDVAGKQRMLSQRMTKEFLFVAVGWDKVNNTKRMEGTIGAFDGGLNNLIKGNTEAKIIGNPTDEIKQAHVGIVNLWGTFKKVLEDNVATIGVNSNMALFQQIETQNVQLLTQSNEVVTLLSDAAKVQAGYQAGLSVNLIGRQRMLVQRMQKEVLLTALGVNVKDNQGRLAGTVETFRTSHDGLIRGATWAGIPVMTNYCAIYRMADATYYAQQCLPLMDAVTSATPSAAIAIAGDEVSPMSNYCNSLFSAVVTAVTYYVSDKKDCDRRDEYTDQAWTYLINNIGKQRYLGQSASTLYMQVVNGVLVETSKVTLLNLLADAEKNVRGLIEGDLANNVQPPPTQAITDKVMYGYQYWSSLKTRIEDAVRLDATNLAIVQEIVGYSEILLKTQNDITAMYVEEAKNYAPEVRPYTIDIAGRQRMLFQKIAKEANLVKFYSSQSLSTDGRWTDLRASIALWKTTHWRLLKGDPSAGVTPTKHLCIVWQMKLAKDGFDALEKAALLVAEGSQKEIAVMADLLPVAFSSMHKAVGYYANGVTTCTTEHDVSLTDRKAVLIGIGRTNSLMQKVVSEFLLSDLLSSAVNNGQNAIFHGAVADAELSLNALKYGSGDVPAPDSDRFQTANALYDVWPSFKLALQGNSTMRRLSTQLADVVAKNQAASSESSALMNWYVSVAGLGVPGKRMEMVSRQLVLASTMVKEALLKRSGYPGADPGAPRSQFEVIQKTLKDGGNGVPKIIEQRADLKAQSERVDLKFNNLDAQVASLAQSSDLSASSIALRSAFDALELELIEAMRIFAEPDPPIPDVFPWYQYIYLTVVLPLMLMVICAGLYSGGLFEDCQKSGTK